jgi:hypothetical protein
MVNIDHVLARQPTFFFASELSSGLSNLEHRVISARRTILIDRERVAGVPYMFNYVTTKSTRSLEPPPAYPGAPPDADRAKKPPLAEPPYKPHGDKPQSESTYEPYKDI